MTESIEWIDAGVELPDVDCAVLVCYQQFDSFDREVTIASYDDSLVGLSPWWVSNAETLPGIVLFWAHMPMGPQR